MGSRASELGASGGGARDPGAGSMREGGDGGVGEEEASSPKDSAGQQAGGFGRRRESQRTRPGHGAAGSGRAASGAAAARAVARGECAWLKARAGGARQLGGDTGGCSAGTLARDGRARAGPWAGTGQRHPAAWSFS